MKTISIQQGKVSDFETQFSCMNQCKPYLIEFGIKEKGKGIRHWYKCSRHSKLTEEETTAIEKRN